MDRLANILDGYIEKKRQKLTALSEEIWRYAEVGFQEFRSAQALERCLEDEGFTLEKGVAGMPTALWPDTAVENRSLDFWVSMMRCLI